MRGNNPYSLPSFPGLSLRSNRWAGISQRLRRNVRPFGLTLRGPIPILRHLRREPGRGIVEVLGDLNAES